VQAAPAEGQALPTILVVDDEPGIVEPLAKIFEKESLRVLTAKSGSEALELLRRWTCSRPVAAFRPKPKPF
jgi:two-component system response regulator HydG